MDTWTKVANFGSGLEADIAVERLRGAGIEAQAKGNDIAGLFGAGFQGTTARGVDVLVPGAQLAAARELLDLDQSAE
ncbi:MAG TPA: DUF2007 domain-containing protein [Gemmatimonadaceae bacterium]